VRTLDLFAGIGGLALAMPSGFELVAAFDQDAAAREAHAANHGVPVLPQDLATASASALQRWDAGGWLLSPPCQPFTRRGRGRDVDDPRCRGLLRIIELLPECRPRRVLVENVEGFHGSRAHALLRDALVAIGHDVVDVSHCPSEDGWPMRRPRQFVVGSADGLRPFGIATPAPRFVEDEDFDDAVLLSTEEAARIAPVHAPPLPWPTITRSYGHAVVGAGPIIPSARGPRRLSPREILRLHAFPASFVLPPALDLRTQWRLAGNSVHVASVRRVAAMIAGGGADHPRSLGARRADAKAPLACIHPPHGQRAVTEDDADAHSATVPWKEPSVDST
jgi:site-specific DNA-cytosine methylase